VLAIGSVVVIISYAILVAGELVPKTLALRYAERIACFSAKPLDSLSRISGLFVRVLTSSTTLVLTALGIKEKEVHVFAPREEIKYFIKEGTAKGFIEETEAALLHGVFEFADTTVKQVMVPRPKFSAIDINYASSGVLKFIAESGFSRYPVYRENINNIVGVLFNKDVFKTLEEGRPIVLAELIRPPYFVPNSIMISRLLRELQRRKVHMAIVVDEHGEVDGLVTIEDILEEIVGEIEDEYDVQEIQVERLSEKEAIMDARVSIGNLNEMFGLNIEAQDFDTVGGYLYSLLGRIPGEGDAVSANGVSIAVLSTVGRRIKKVKVSLLNGECPGPTEDLSA